MTDVTSCINSTLTYYRLPNLSYVPPLNLDMRRQGTPVRGYKNTVSSLQLSRYTMKESCRLFFQMKLIAIFFFSLSPASPTSPTPSIPSIEPTSPLSGSSTYFTTSEAKAKLLTRYSQDMKNCVIVKNTKDLSQKKVRTISN